MTVISRRSKTLLVLAVVAIASLSGCTPPMEETHRDDVVGTWTYSADESNVGVPVPEAVIQLNDDNTVTVRNFPRSHLSEKLLSEATLDSSGTWEFQEKYNDKHKYENQSAVSLVLDQPGAPAGPKIARRLAIEKKDGKLKLAIYLQYPDLLDNTYALSKKL